MYKLISDIAERCHTAAEKRGKDTTANGCIEALRTEQQEYWNAVDKGHYVPDFDVMVREATKLSDSDFTALYEAKIHNSVADELADIVITAATWLQTAKNKAGEDFQPDRDIDVLLLNGAVQFACRQITGENDVRELQAAVNLKMRYNELRKD